MYNKDNNFKIENEVSSSKEAVKLDIIMKNLFNASDRMLVNVLNGLFDENFKQDEVEVTLEESEFSRSDELDIIRADKIISLASKPHNKKHYFNIEFQTLNDSSMAIRMFEYGFASSIKNLKREKANSNVTVIEMPKPLVMFLEENKNIKDELIIRFIFPYTGEIDYKVKVVKYWELKQEEVMNKKMYILLPIRIFNLRKELYKIMNLKDEEKLVRLEEKKNETRTLSKDISEMAKKLYDGGEITDLELHNIIMSVQNLVEYLNRNFIDDQELEEEVINMTKTLYDPVVEERGIQKGIIKIAKKMILAGKGIDEIVEITELTIEEVENIIEEVQKDQNMR